MFKRHTDWGQTQCTLHVHVRITYFNGVFGTDWAALSFESMVSIWREVSLWNTNLPVPATQRIISGVSHLEYKMTAERIYTTSVHTILGIHALAVI